MKVVSLPKHENLTIGEKYCGKKGSNFSSFPQYFRYISNFKNPITHIFVKCGCSNYFFLNSANLICRGTDIWKYFRESFRIRDNESLLYFDQATSFTHTESVSRLPVSDTQRLVTSFRHTETGYQFQIHSDYIPSTHTHTHKHTHTHRLRSARTYRIYREYDKRRI